MRFASDDAPCRPDYFALGHGVAVRFDPEAEPYIQWDHIDGPLLHLRCATVHWLTWRERFRVHMGWDDVYSLERKHAPPGFVDRWEARARAAPRT